MNIIVHYSCFQDQHLIAANLRHIYDFADRIVVSYGAFRGIRRIRTLWGLPEEDGTREILKSFPDPDGKVTLVEAPDGEWEDFTESRRRSLAACGTSGFLMTQDTDEFWARGALERIRHAASHRLENGVVALDCTRPWFVQGSHQCLWPLVGLPYLVPHTTASLPGPAGRAASSARRLLRGLSRRCASIGLWKRRWTVFEYANGLAYLPSPPHHIHKVAGFLLKPGLFWIQNRIDSRLMDPATGEPWHRHERAIYDPDLFCFHISYCDPAITHVKETYYRTVFAGLSPEQAYREVGQQETAGAAGSEVKGYRVRPLPERLRALRPPELLEVTGGGG